MSEVYIAVNRTGDSNEELQHYGVKGMRWGVRRATKQLAKATTKEEKSKAVAKLQKHREKASKEVAKLEKKHPKLEKKVEQNILKNETKAAKLHDKATTKSLKSERLFMRRGRRARLKYSARKLEKKAQSLQAKSDLAKAELKRNETMQAAFKKGINEIDQTLVSKGRKFING